MKTVVTVDTELEEVDVRAWDEAGDEVGLPEPEPYEAALRDAVEFLREQVDEALKDMWHRLDDIEKRLSHVE